MTPEQLKKKKAAFDHHIDATSAVDAAVKKGKAAGLDDKALAESTRAEIIKHRAPQGPASAAAIEVEAFLAREHSPEFLRVLWEALSLRYGEDARPNAEWLKRKVATGHRTPPSTK